MGGGAAKKPCTAAPPFLTGKRSFQDAPLPRARPCHYSPAVPCRGSWKTQILFSNSHLPPLVGGVFPFPPPPPQAEFQFPGKEEAIRPVDTPPWWGRGGSPIHWKRLTSASFLSTKNSGLKAGDLPMAPALSPLPGGGWNHPALVLEPPGQSNTM